MSEISEKVRDQMWHILHDHKREDEWATVVFAILSIPEIAIVDREAELPRWLCDPALTVVDNIRGYKELLRKEGWGKEIKA